MIASCVASYNYICIDMRSVAFHVYVTWQLDWHLATFNEKLAQGLC